MAIKLITLKTNESFIGDVSAEGDIVKIKQPLQIIVQPSKTGNLVGFAPYLDFTEEFTTGIEFDAENILTVNNPLREILNEYSKIFGSGIEIVSSLKNLK